MDMNLTKISPKGEVILPGGIVKKVDISDDFFVYASKDTIVLKKLNKPSKKERFEEICKKSEKHAKEMGVKEGDIDRLIHKYRTEKQKT